MQRHHAIITTTCGDRWSTDINGDSPESVALYFYRHQFNLGDGDGGDRMVTVSSVTVDGIPYRLRPGGRIARG